jgi:acyl-CoA synthetase (AMP-forming)/AMP-acid ligase II/acyl carrier protein
MAAPCTLLDLLDQQANRTPSAPAIGALGRSVMDYASLRAQVLNTRQQLRSAGVRQHDRVALVLPNGPEMAVAFLAVASSAASAPLNPLYREAEFDFFLEDLAPRAIILLAGQPSPARAAALQRGIPVLELQPLPSAPAGAFDLIFTEMTPADDELLPAPRDVALILHTSGTTARPKMVPLTQANLCASAAHIAESLALVPADRCLNVMPLFHIHGLIAAVLSSLRAGASVVCTPGFHAPDFLSWLKNECPTWYTAVPTMHQSILARTADADGDLRQTALRFIRSSSSSLAPQVMRDLERVFGAPVIEAYGMTEASHQIASNPLPPQARKPGSVGLAAGPQVAVLAEDNAEILAAGKIGEIAIRGPNVTLGYVANPQANEKAFTAGWFRTGDQGYMDEQGYLYLTGRLKELINRGGEKISPREVDEALLLHPAVEQAVTFAMPDAMLGEDVAAAVVLRDRSATEYDLRRFVAGHLAHFKVPQRIVILDELPKGATGKLQRIGLAQKLGVENAAPPAESAGEAVRAETDTEKIMCALWSELLQVDEPSVTRRFRDLGGDSMTATLLVTRISQQFALDIELLDLFDTPTIRAQAALIDQMRADTARGTGLPVHDAH